MTTLAFAHSDHADLAVRFGLDFAAIVLLVGVVYLRRHARRDLSMVYVCFNVGLFAVLAVISSGHIGVAVGFGLFGMLSIIRLRSEPFNNVELGYFFMSLVLALVNGIGGHDRPVTLALDTVVLLAVLVVDHPRFRARAERVLLTLDGVHANRERLRAELALRFGVERVELGNMQLDDIRETTYVEVLLVHGRRPAHPRPGTSGSGV
jgi:hypothetical protein